MRKLYEPCSFFFFSSRRRHTRLTCDWSSDVWLFRSAGQPDPDSVPGQTSPGGEDDETALSILGTVKTSAAPVVDAGPALNAKEIGRASCRERWKISVETETEKKKRR